jgi:hypothetical protein
VASRLAPQIIWQRGDVDRAPPRLVSREQFRRRFPPGQILEINIRERLARKFIGQPDKGVAGAASVPASVIPPTRTMRTLVRLTDAALHSPTPGTTAQISAVGIWIVISVSVTRPIMVARVVIILRTGWRGSPDCQRTKTYSCNHMFVIGLRPWFPASAFP